LSSRRKTRIAKKKPGPKVRNDGPTGGGLQGAGLQGVETEEQQRF